MPVVEMRRRETVPAISSAHYYRQRYAVMVVERNFPAIAVAEMRENNLLGVYLA